MDAYELLRRQAADKMDKAIKAARDEYKSEVAKINELRTALGVPSPLGLRTRKRIGDMLAEHYPTDRTFTVDEVIASASAVYPEIRFKRATVNAAMQRQKEQGTIRRVCKQVGGACVWAVADFVVTEMPFGAMPYSDVIAELLEDSTGMRPSELVVAMQTLGYRTEYDATQLMRKVSQSLYANSRRFKRDSQGKWTLVK